MCSEVIRSFGEICEGEFEVVLLTEEDLEGALNVIRNSFLLYENCCIATEIDRPESETAREDLIELCREVFSMGVSLVAKEISTGQVVSVAVNIIHVATPPEEIGYIQSFSKNRCRTPNSKALLEFMYLVDSSYDYFRTLKIDSLMEVMFLATLPEFTGRKIAKSLCLYSLELAKELTQGKRLGIIREDLRDKRIGAVTAIMTAKASQQIGQSIGMTTVLEVPFDKFSFNGKTFAERIGPAISTFKLMMIKT